MPYPANYSQVKEGRPIYEAYFGLKEMPFSVHPDPRFAYESMEHRIAVAKMRHAADQRLGLATLTGPIGVGKTTCANFLAKVFSEDPGKTVAFLPSAAVRTPASFFRLLLPAYGLRGTRNEADGRSSLENFLIAEYKAGRHPILLLDEGQDVSHSNIDTLSSLTNFQTAQSKLITIIVLAQDNFPRKLERKEAFTSRIAIVAHLDPLSPSDMRAMLDYRLRVAGGTDASAIFDDESVIQIYNITKGIPRDVCVLCNAVLIEAVIRQSKRIDPAIVETVFETMRETKRWPVTLKGEK